MHTYLREGICRSEQNVFRFQVTVNNVFKVQMPQSDKNLPTNRKKVYNVLRKTTGDVIY